MAQTSFDVTQLNYTYPGELLRDIIILPAVSRPDFRNLFDVRQVKDKLTFGMVNELGLGLKAYSGCTALDDTGADEISFYNRTLTVEDMELIRKFCPDDLRNTLYDTFTRNGNDYPNLIGSELATVLLNPLFEENIKNELFRILSFGKKAATGSNAAYFNMMDGLWETIYQGTNTYTPGSSTVDCTTVVTESLNSLSGSATYTALVALTEGANIVLKSEVPELKRIFCTLNFWEAYQGYRETATGIVDSWRRIEDGVVRLYFRGIELVPIAAWDSYITAYPTETRWGSSAKNVRLLYTKVNNHVLGFDAPNGGTGFEAFYDNVGRQNYFTTFFRAGYQFIDCRMNAVSLGNV